MAQIEYFITSADQVKIVKSTRKFPPIEVIIDKENNKVNFDKIAELVSKDLRGGYIIESGIEHWNGFGLKKINGIYRKQFRYLFKSTRSYL